MSGYKRGGNLVQSMNRVHRFSRQCKTNSQTHIIHKIKIEEISTEKEVWICDEHLHKLSQLFTLIFSLKDECPIEALRACVFIYLPYILKNNVEFRRK